MADCPAPRKGRAQGSIRWHNAPEGTEETKNGKGRGMGNPVVHFEIVSKEGGKLKSFYSEAFGWKIDADNAMGYGIVEAEGEGIGGVSPTRRVTIRATSPSTSRPMTSRGPWLASRSWAVRR